MAGLALPPESRRNGLAKGVALDIPRIAVATITVHFAVVVGSWYRKAHGQQEALTVATKAVTTTKFLFQAAQRTSQGRCP